MTSFIERDSAAEERQIASDDFALRTFTAGKDGLANLYPVALARSKRATSPRDTVTVNVAHLLALCHAHGLAMDVLGRVPDDALVMAMVALADPAAG